MSTNKVIIEVRINEYTMRDDNPHVPYSPEEIAKESLDCWREERPLSTTTPATRRLVLHPLILHCTPTRSAGSKPKVT